MSKFIKTIASFLGTVPLLMSKGMASTPVEYSALEILQEPSAVQLRPLNFEADNLFARHGSHASHASHASHYSGAGSSGYVSPPVSPPQYPTQNSYTAPSESTITPNPNTYLDSSTQRPAVKPVPSDPISTESPVLTTASKLKLQIIRVQIALTSLKYYDGPLDGVMSASTRRAIENFQIAKGLPKSGKMTTPTMNALGVPAVT